MLRIIPVLVGRPASTIAILRLFLGSALLVVVPHVRFGGQFSRSFIVATAMLSIFEPEFRACWSLPLTIEFKVAPDLSHDKKYGKKVRNKPCNDGLVIDLD
jgi:hypothetical protein